MNNGSEFQFEFFNDLFRKEDYSTNLCNAHNDVFVSYCHECRHPLCVKCLLTHSRSFDTHRVQSFNELRTSLLSTINQTTDNLKQNLDRLEKFRLHALKDSEIGALRQKGIDQIQHLRQKIFEKLNLYFDTIHVKWLSMFDENHLLSVQKDKIVRELSQLIKMYLKARQQYNSLDQAKVLQYEDLKEIIGTISLVKKQDLIDSRVSSFLNQLDTKARNTKFPELAVNKLVQSKIYDEFNSILDYTLDSSLDQLSSGKPLNIKMNEFFKSPKPSESTMKSMISIKPESQQISRLIPIVAKNRRLMVFDASICTFKELVLSELHSIPHGIQLLVMPNNPHRFLMIGGHYFKKPSNKVYELDSSTSEFKVHEPMIRSRWLHRAVIHKNSLYVTGGIDNEKETPVASVEVFDTESLKWSEVKPMKYARHSHSIFVFETQEKSNTKEKKTASIYVLGGIGVDKQYVRTIEKFDFDKGFWTECPLKNGLGPELVGPFATQINEKEILIFGGFKYFPAEDSKSTKSANGTQYLKYPFNNSNVLLYNIEEAVISTSQHFNLPFGVLNTGSQLIYTQKKIYFVGGLNTTCTYPDLPLIDFSTENSLQKVIGSIGKDTFEIVDHVMFN